MQLARPNMMAMLTEPAALPILWRLLCVKTCSSAFGNNPSKKNENLHPCSKYFQIDYKSLRLVLLEKEIFVLEYVYTIVDNNIAFQIKEN